MTLETRPTPEAVHYGPGSGYRRCWNCQRFALPQPGDAASADTVHCTLLARPVEPTAVCDEWAEMADRARKRTGFRSGLRRHGQFIWDDGESGGGGRGGSGGTGSGPAGL
jgi:hypothetical protein